MENSCPFKIAEESEVGTIISSKEMIWKDVRHVKVHLIKFKYNPNNMLPDINYLIAIITCYGSTDLPISGFTRCTIGLKTLISFLHDAKVMCDRRIFSSINEESIGDKFFHEIKNFQQINQYTQPMLPNNQSQSLSFFSQNMT